MLTGIEDAARTIADNYDVTIRFIDHLEDSTMVAFTAASDEGSSVKEGEDLQVVRVHTDNGRAVVHDAIGASDGTWDIEGESHFTSYHDGLSAAAQKIASISAGE